MDNKIAKLIKEEGDYLAGEYKGYKWRIIRMAEPSIHLCGYVGLPITHKYYTKPYDDIPVDVHGGLTYGRDYLIKQPETDLYWIGFDCAHAGDCSSLDYQFSHDDIYRDMKYVKVQIEQLIDQLAETVDTNESDLLQELKEEFVKDLEEIEPPYDGIWDQAHGEATTRDIKRIISKYSSDKQV